MNLKIRRPNLKHSKAIADLLKVCGPVKPATREVGGQAETAAEDWARVKKQLAA